MSVIFGSHPRRYAVQESPVAAPDDWTTVCAMDDADEAIAEAQSKQSFSRDYRYRVIDTQEETNE